MMLHDQDGAVIVPYGQLFEYRSNPESLATLEVVCADSAMSTTMEPIICARLVSGVFIRERDGQRVGIGPKGEQPMFLFTGEFVATQVRAYRSRQQPAQTEPKERSTRKSKQRPQADHQTSEDLFHGH